MENNQNKNDWSETTERFVGFIDIIGFKDMVARKSPKEIYDLMKKLSESKKEAAENENFQIDGVRITTYSDSIIVYSKGSDKDSWLEFRERIGYLTSSLFHLEIPFKGSVAYGIMTTDFEESIFFGQPLIDAYYLQDELLFYGTILHASAEQKIHSLGFSINHDLIEYNCPFKNGMSKHVLILPFTIFFCDWDQELVERIDFALLSINNLKYQSSGHLRKYFDNTIMYFEYIKDRIYRLLTPARMP